MVILALNLFLIVLGCCYRPPCPTFHLLCTFQQNQGFEIDERRETEEEVKGKRTAYFLRKNLHATENEMKGRMPHCSQADWNGSTGGLLA